jgi:hypothetical protein
MSSVCYDDDENRTETQSTINFSECVPASAEPSKTSKPTTSKPMYLLAYNPNISRETATFATEASTLLEIPNK